MQVAEVAAEAEHPLGRSQDLQELVAALVRLEEDGAAERRVLAEKLASLIEVSVLDGEAEAIGQHRRGGA